MLVWTGDEEVKGVGEVWPLEYEGFGVPETNSDGAGEGVTVGATVGRGVATRVFVLMLRAN